MTPYGRELILDISHANVAKFGHDSLERFVKELCEEIGMEREDLCFWEYETPETYEAAPPHLKGISLVQFITTSSVVLHTLDDLGCMCLNVFSCREFDAKKTVVFCAAWFDGEVDSWTQVARGERFACPLP